MIGKRGLCPSLRPHVPPPHTDHCSRFRVHSRWKNGAGEAQEEADAVAYFLGEYGLHAKATRMNEIIFEVEEGEAPRMIRIHFVRDELIAG